MLWGVVLCKTARRSKYSTCIACGETLVSYGSKILALQDGTILNYYGKTVYLFVAGCTVIDLKTQYNPTFVGIRIQLQCMTYSQ